MVLLPKRLHARTLLFPSRRGRALSTSSTRPASWWDIGNMGNYGQPGHYEQPANGIGSKPKDHVTRTWDKRNIQNTYSKDGRMAKMNADRKSSLAGKGGSVGEEGLAGAGVGGSAITERDIHGANKRAETDMPEAPVPVIGMNDERGALGTINEPLGDRLTGMGTKSVPSQTNEMLMKWKVSDETMRAGGRVDE